MVIVGWGILELFFGEVYKWKEWLFLRRIRIGSFGEYSGNVGGF